MFSHLRRDLARLAHKGRWSALDAFLFDNGFQAVVCYRLARWFKVRRVPVLGALVARTGLFLTGADISPRAEIGPGLRITHGVGVVIGGFARIGADAHILHNVTVGSVAEQRLEQMPAVGDRVFLGAGAFLLGPIRVGDGAFVGAGALVTRDIPAGARVLSRAGLDVSIPATPASRPAAGDEEAT